MDNCYATAFYMTGFFDDFLNVNQATTYGVFEVLPKLEKPTDYCFIEEISPVKTIPPSDYEIYLELNFLM